MIIRKNIESLTFKRCWEQAACNALAFMIITRKCGHLRSNFSSFSLFWGSLANCSRAHYSLIVIVVAMRFSFTPNPPLLAISLSPLITSIFSRLLSPFHIHHENFAWLLFSLAQYSHLYGDATFLMSLCACDNNFFWFYFIFRALISYVERAFLFSLHFLSRFSVCHSRFLSLSLSFSHAHADTCSMALLFFCVDHPFHICRVACIMHIM